MATLDRTYQIAAAPAPPESWSAYSARITGEWIELLDGARVPERRVHRFLEQHPCLIPGAEGGYRLGGHHPPLYTGVFSNPELPGLNRPRPDFMWIRKDSERVVPVIIEIERPSKAWFTKLGQPTSEHTQAMNQIDTWRHWFNLPANVLQFRTLYGVDLWAPDHYFAPEYVLVFGRRAEFDKRQELRGLRAAKRAVDVSWMTFDRLAPASEASDYLTLRIRRMKVAALAFPATFTLGPGNADELKKVTGKRAAMLRSFRH